MAAFIVDIHRYVIHPLSLVYLSQLVLKLACFELLYKARYISFRLYAGFAQF